ncbi:MAG: hypothetical protein ABEK16_04775 [Candidatus Nanohalobium sp.]
MEYEFESFQEIDWDRGSVLVEGEVVDIPQRPYAENTFLVHYFDEKEDMMNL